MHKIILIRADGGKNIGMGHLSRASLISDYMHNRFSVNTLLLYKNNEETTRFLENKSIRSTALPADIQLKEETELIKEHINLENCGLFVLDVLDNDINKDFTKEIRSCKIPFAAITDDSHKRVIDADVIINGNPCQKENYYKKEKGNYYIGPKYFIMDENYSRIKIKKPSGEIKHILLTVGGSDHNNLIFKILEAIEKINNSFYITLITSEATGYIKQLKEYILSMRNEVNLLIDIKGIISEWKNCDFAITAGGNTLFERIAASIPGLTICQLKRQMEIADKFEEFGVNYNLGFGPDLTVDDIYSRLKNYLSQYSHHLTQFNKARAYVDGDGLSRVSKIFNNLLLLT